MTSSLLFETTFIAAPESTYEGLISTGNPMPSTNSVYLLNSWSAPSIVAGRCPSVSQHR
ncbi:MAG: hypothetical protein MZV63_24570 [Marinilabiliales bacterium]|nr:hypothetical protein [Marinilabiliales bacterium]